MLGLENAFAPPAVAGVVGLVIPQFRKARYTRMASLRNQLQGMGDALLQRSDLAQRQTRLDERLRDTQQQLSREHARQLQQIQAGLQSAIRESTQQARQLLHASPAYQALVRKQPLDMGRYVYPPVAGGEQPLLSMAVGCDGFEEGVLLRPEDATPLCAAYAGLALDILTLQPGAQIVMIDVAGLGSGYACLAALTGSPGFQVLSTQEQVRACLETVAQQVAAAYAGEAPAQKTYLFVDDCLHNIPEACIDTFLGILTNGPRSGVFVMVSVRENTWENCLWCRALESLPRKPYAVAEGKLLLGNAHIALAPVGDLAARAAAVAEDLTRASARQEVLPIGNALPQPAARQTQSSETGIFVPFGKNTRTGGEVSFCLTEEKPYALMIGDVDVGKSSAMHCIALQIMDRYGPGEVRLGIGDFKDGCEFDSYVRGGAAAVDVVVNSQDPDAMASFLGYYVAQMHRRQALFEQIAGHCGRMIRKYETYRAVCREEGIAHVPRLCLIIDEFQSLFDTACGTSSLLSELVRKGRTYGIHLIMASQRAISDNPRSGFTTELKNYFTTRLVFRCPQPAARTMLTERCADTGRENPGIAQAAMLKKGHCILNTYMGQTQKDNTLVQCYYADDGAIERGIRMLHDPGKRGVLLSRKADSVAPPGRVAGYALLGQSVRFLHDYACPNEDVFRDNTVVGLELGKLPGNLAVISRDVQLRYACARAILDGAGPETGLFLCGPRSDPFVRLLLYLHPGRLTHAETVDDLPQEPQGSAIHLIVQPENEEAYAQASTYRRSETVERFDKLLDLPSRGGAVNVLLVSDFRQLKTNLPYAAAKVPLRIVGVEDSENLRLAIGESVLLDRSGFDVPTRRAIKAYYHNKMSGKTGKFIAYRPVDP